MGMKQVPWRKACGGGSIDCPIVRSSTRGTSRGRRGPSPSCLHGVRQILWEDLVVLTGGDDGQGVRGSDRGFGGGGGIV